MPECQHCGATIRYGRNASHDPHECCGSGSVDHVVAVQAYNEDVRQQSYNRFRLRQFTDLAMDRIRDGMEIRDAIERAVSAAFGHGRSVGRLSNEPVST